MKKKCMTLLIIRKGGLDLKRLRMCLIILLICTISTKPSIISFAAYGDYYYQENIKVADAKTALNDTTLHKTTIVIMDCGVDEDYYIRAKKKKAMITSFYLKKFEKYSDFNENQHGTMVNCIVDETIRKLGVQSKIKTIHLKWRGSTYEYKDVVENFLNAIDKIIKNKDKYNIKVVNFSADMNIGSEYEVKKVKAAVKKLNDAGITFVAAAGNMDRAISIENSLSRLSDQIIFVGATDIQNKKAKWSDGLIQYASCTGKQLDLVAPGEEIDFGYQIGFFDYYCWNSGTSLAAPQVSVGVALMNAINPSLKPSKIESMLKNSATNLGKQKKDRNNTYGYGLLNLEKAVKSAKKSVAK